MWPGRIRRCAADFPVSWTRVLLCFVTGAAIGLTLTFYLNVENLLLFMVGVWGGLLPLGILGIRESNQVALGVSLGLAHGALLFVAAFTVASIRYGRDSSPRFDITAADVVLAALLYGMLCSIPGDVTV